MLSNSSVAWNDGALKYLVGRQAAGEGLQPAWELLWSTMSGDVVIYIYLKQAFLTFSKKLNGPGNSTILQAKTQ